MYYFIIIFFTYFDLRCILVGYFYLLYTNELKHIDITIDKL